MIVVQSSIKVSNHFVPEMDSRTGPQTWEWIKSNGKLLFTRCGIRCMMMLWQLTNTTIERLNKLGSEQMRDPGFYKVERGMPKSFMMKPYLGMCPCF